MRRLKPGTKIRDKKRHIFGTIMASPLHSLYANIGEVYQVDWGRGCIGTAIRGSFVLCRKWRGLSEAQLYQQGYYYLSSHLNLTKSLLVRIQQGGSLKAPNKVQTALALTAKLLEDSIPEFGMYINLKKKEKQTDDNS